MSPTGDVMRNKHNQGIKFTPYFGRYVRSQDY